MGSEPSDDLKKGTKINLPFWMMEELYLKRMVRVYRPSYFQAGTRFVERLLADPKVVDIRRKCKYWYLFGHKLCQLTGTKDIAEWMKESLQSRNEEIIDQSHYYKSPNSDQFRSFLCY